MAKTRTYFSNTVYSIIYALIEKKKIGLFFVPSIRSGTKFFTSNNPINVVGGYDFNLRRIEIVVKWSFGVDAIAQMFENHIPLICNKIFALILSEALLIYNYKNNGVLVKNNESVNKWYRIYFEGVFGDTLQRPSLAKNMAAVVSENFPSRIYERVEKAIIEGRSPSIKVSNKGENTELELEGIPSIKKGDKELEDVWGDCIEDYVNEHRDDFNIDNDSYKDLKELWKEFAEFGSFLYKNRDVDLDPKNLEEMPTDDKTFDNRFRKDAEYQTANRLEEEAEEKENKAFQSYLESNPNLKKILTNTENTKFDKLASKHFNQFAGHVTIQRVQVDPNDPNSVREVAIRDYGDVRNYIRNPGDTYISRFLTTTQPSLDDLRDCINGTRRNIEDYQQTQNRYIQMIRNGEDPSSQRARSTFELLRIQQAQANATYSDITRLFAQLTAGTNNASLFYDTSRQIRRDGSQRLPQADLNSNDVFRKLEQMENLVTSQESIEQERSKNMLSSSLEKIGQNIRSHSIKNILTDPTLLRSVRRDITARQAEIARMRSELEYLQRRRASGDNSVDSFIKTTASDLYNTLTNTSAQFKDLSQVLTSDSERAREWRSIRDERMRLRDERAALGTVTSHRQCTIGSSNIFEQNRAENSRRIMDIQHPVFNPHGTMSDTDNLFNALNDSYMLAKDVRDSLRSGHFNDANLMNSETLNRMRSASFDIPTIITSNIFLRAPGIVNTSTGLNRNNFNQYVRNLANSYPPTTSRTDWRDRLARAQREIYSRITSSDLRTQNSTLRNGIQNYDRNVVEHYGGIRNARGWNFNRIREWVSDPTRDVSRAQERSTRRLTNFRNSFRNLNDYADFIRNDRATEKMQAGYGNQLDLVRGIRDPNLLPRGENLSDDAIRDLCRAGENWERMQLLLNGPPPQLIGIGNRRILNPQEGYTRQLFLSGIGYISDCLPDWSTIKEYASNLKNKAKDTFYLLRSIYRFVKIILPLKSNIQMYANQKFGFGNIAAVRYFDLSYKLTFNLKKMYEIRTKSTVRKDMVYSEIYMPSTILKKALYAHLVTQNDFNPQILYLVNCALKGLEEFM